MLAGFYNLNRVSMDWKYKVWWENIWILSLLRSDDPMGFSYQLLLKDQNRVNRCWDHTVVLYIFFHTVLKVFQNEQNCTDNENRILISIKAFTILSFHFVFICVINKKFSEITKWCLMKEMKTKIEYQWSFSCNWVWLLNE